MSSLEEDGGFREVTKRFWVLRLVTEVREDGLYVRLAPIERSFRHIPSEDIAEVRQATYTPATYDGWHWGVRGTTGGDRVYRLEGDEGVEVVRSSGVRWFVGSGRPTDLADALEDCRGMA